MKTYIKRQIHSQIKRVLKMSEFNSALKKEINRVLDGGYIEPTKYKGEGYKLPKLVLYLALKRLTTQFKPLMTTKSEDTLIRNY